MHFITLLYLTSLLSCFSFTSIPEVDKVNSKCSPITNSVIFCSLWGSDHAGGLAQKATFQLGLRWSIHGVWGLESLKTSRVNSYFCEGDFQFMNWYCKNKYVPLMIEPGHSAENYTACYNYPSGWNIPTHAKHECRCHAGRYGINATTWLKYLQTCENAESYSVYPDSCRWSSAERCNYVQQWYTKPDYARATGCRFGARVCNPIYDNTSSYYLVGTEDNFKIIPHNLWLATNNTNDWPHHSEITSFQWTIIGIFIFLALLIIATFIIVFFMCHNGRIQKNPVPDYWQYYKSYRKRKLLALHLNVTYRKTFNGPPISGVWKIIIGGTKCDVSPSALVGIPKNLSEQTVKGTTYWSWRYEQTDCHFNISYRFGSFNKICINWGFLERKYGRVDTVHKIDFKILNEDYSISQSVTLFSGSREMQTNLTGNYNPYFKSLSENHRQLVRVYLLRTRGNSDLIFDPNGTDELRNISTTVIKST